MRHARVVRVALLVALCGAAPAWAGDEEEGGGSAEARKRFSDGKARYAAGDYQGAIEAWQAGVALDPNLAGFYRNLGLAYRAVGRCADALPMYERYLEKRPQSRFTERVRREIDLCKGKLGLTVAPPPPPRATAGTSPAAPAVIRVEATLPGAGPEEQGAVRVDGVLRGATPMSLILAPGRHLIRVEHHAYVPEERSVEVASGAQLDVELTLRPRADAAAPLLDEGERLRLQAERGRRLRRAGWSLLGVAAVFAVVGAALGIVESALHRDVAATDPMSTTRADIDAQADRARAYGIGAYVGLAAGGAALIAAVACLVAGPSRALANDRLEYGPPRAGLSLAPGGLTVRW